MALNALLPQSMFYVLDSKTQHTKLNMGWTVPSYRIATEMERNKWKKFKARIG